MRELEENTFFVRLPKGAVVCGHAAVVKWMDENGHPYWSIVKSGLNDMEAMGMAHDMSRSFERLLVKKEVDG